MAKFSFLSNVAMAAAGAYALTRYSPGHAPIVNLNPYSTFSIIYSLILAWKIVYHMFLYPKWLSPLNKLPKPPAGALGIMDSSGSVSAPGRERWKPCVPHQGFLYYLHIFNSQRVIVASPSAVQELCVRADDFTKPRLIRLLAERFLGLGLVLAETEQHRAQRRVFLPIFAPRHVREMYPIFWAKTREVTQKLAGIVESAAVQGSGKERMAVMEVGHWSSRAALDIVTMATLGKDFGSVENENSLLAKSYRNALEPTRGHLVQAMFKLFFPSSIVDNIPNRWNRALAEYVPIFRGTCRDLLIEKRNAASDETIKTKGKDLLSLCFQYEESARANEEELIDQLTTFLAAGHETISVGITWAVYMLCLHPEWQTLLREETRAHFPDPTDGAGAAAVPDPFVVETLPLLQAFIHEVLRWYPPIPETMREPLRDTVVDGQFLPKGLMLVVPIKGIMRQETCFGPDAAVFNPRRWLTEKPVEEGEGAGGATKLAFNSTGGATSKYANLSFMQGVRSCIAMNFAKAEMACIIAAWVGRFKFELEDPSLMDEKNMRISNGSFSGRPANGLNVKWGVVDGWGTKTATKA
ncbi:cytochrome p450 monooxygenase [Apiospora kogelbergensis]|uniref:Cytochrome p450 monooxygenase n=1 Tax=Apiospora kogelbergensis TaxID=1337665 RepID=A0AAW0QNP0_9PEZI